MSSEEAAAHLFGSLAEQEQRSTLRLQVERLWQSDHCDFVSCDTCQYCFAVPFRQGDEAFYTLTYHSESQYAIWKWEFQETYDALQSLAHQGKLARATLLDIGAGNGAFEKRVTPALLRKENIVCLEHSEAGRKSITNLGISCFSQDIRTMDWERFQTRFDIVCMFQILEHLDNLDSLFECLNQITRRAATVFIAVPNDVRREFFDRRGIIEDVPPTHVGRFSRVSLELLAKRHGWQIAQHKREPESFVSKVKSFASHAISRSTRWNHVGQIKSPFLRRCSIAVAAAICLARSLPTVARLRSNELGVSQWARLEKI